MLHRSFRYGVPLPVLLCLPDDQRDKIACGYIERLPIRVWRVILTNLKNVLGNADLPVMHGIVNSLVVALCSAALAVYFSALTAYGVHAYNFRLKKFANLFIMLVMMIPTQVTTLGFLNLISKMGLMDNLLPCFSRNSFSGRLLFHDLLHAGARCRWKSLKPHVSTAAVNSGHLTRSCCRS